MAAWKRLVLTGLIVCLPVPALAATGLAVPLPSIVYRVAVGIAEGTQAVAVGVPGFEAVVAETTQVARRGAIRLSAEELAVAGDTTNEAAPSALADHVEAGSRQAQGRTHIRESTPARARVDSVELQQSVETAPEHAPARQPEGDAGVQRAEDQQPPAAPVQSERSAPSSQPRSDRPDGPPASSGADEPRDSSPDTPARVPEPSSGQPREEPKGGSPGSAAEGSPGSKTPPPPSPTPPPPPPPVIAPPPPLPPVVVLPPVDPLPGLPLTQTPGALLEGIAADLRSIAGEHVDSSGPQRVAAALERVEDARTRLANAQHPDNQGALGQISNAIQKLDQAIEDGELAFDEGAQLINRLNAVVQLIEGAIE